MTAVRQRVAVIGSGIAGLAAAWGLKAAHEVTLFERHTRLGMDALSMDVGERRIDVPMRVVYEGYYPCLSRLYRDAGVELEPLEYSGTFTEEGQTYLSYRNIRIGRRALPMLRGRRALTRRTLPLVLDALRFFRSVQAEVRKGAADGRTLAEYLQWRGYSQAFAEGFLVPVMAGICTCTLEAVRRYPATVILGYFAAGLFSVPVSRARHGIADVVSRLSAGVQQIRLGAAVEAIVPAQGGVRVRAGGAEFFFDQVVIATQANHALEMLQGSEVERAALASFTYQSSEVVMHSDERLAPPDRGLWGPVNFILDARHEMPMATIWMNTVHGDLPGDLFQTWNPIVEPRPERVIHRVRVQRPVVDAASQRGLAMLDTLHAQPGRRVWFCGAYAAPGVPLLESATASGLRAAARVCARAALRETAAACA
jgi:predicted NAD/FAD-binding protein